MNALIFLIKTLFNLYLIAILLKILLQIACIDIFNPLHQFIIRITAVPLIPFEKIIPRIKGFDTPASVFALLLNGLKIFLLASTSGKIPAISGLIVWTLGDLCGQLFNLYFYLILLSALFSWFAPMRQMPIIYVFYRLTEPLFARCRALIPAWGGIDFSPIILLFLVQILSTAIAVPLIHLGIKLSFG